MQSKTSLYGGSGNDTIRATLGDNELDDSLIQDGAGNNTFIVTANTTVDTLTVKGGSGKDELSITADTEDFSFKGGAESDSVLVTVH